MKQLKIAVLMGGPSTERPVSLRSGAAVANALTASGAKVVPVDVRDEKFVVPRDVDVAFIALHGTFGEDGTVQQILEEAGVPYTGSGPESSACAFDKVAAKGRFEAMGIPTPAYQVIERTRGDLGRLARLGFPLVIKPARQGSSVGVSIVNRQAELEEACQISWQYDDHLVAEQFVAGRELTVGIFDGHALPVIEIRPQHGFFTYENKYTQGQTDYLVPAPLDRSIEAATKALALRTHDCLGCRDYSRVDLILGDDGNLSVLELNTIPGFTETSLVPKAAHAAGIEFQDLCVRLVQMALARRSPAPRIETRVTETETVAATVS